MEKEFLIQSIDSGLSSHEISNKTGKCQTTVRYWLNKYGLKTKTPNKNKGEKNHTYIDGYEYKLCPRCKENKKISSFCIRKRNNSDGDYYSYCKPCLSEQKKERHKAFKRKCIEYKGGKCVCCDYDKCDSALEFHHRDSEEKEYEISKKSKTKSFEDVKYELDKCELVCSNCHREIHAGIRKLPSY